MAMDLLITHENVRYSGANVLKKGRAGRPVRKDGRMKDEGGRMKDEGGTRTRKDERGDDAEGERKKEKARV
ncbi:MAG: hypothetical protein ACXWH7_15475, partial [Thermoanaerobaculia bacterium]